MKSNILSFNTTKKIIDDFTKRYFQYQDESNFNNKYIYKQFIFDKTKITFYTNKKNEYKCVIQGNNLENFIKQFSKELNYQIENNQINQDNYKINELENKYTIGTDEVGVGDYFGGIVVCAVYTGPKLNKLLKSWGVDDSKKINDKNIHIMAKEIMAVAPYEKIYISNQQYNQLINKFNNSHIIKTIGHFQVISQLKEEIMKRNWPIDKIVIDQFANIQSVKKYLQTINANNYNLTNIELIEHAESKIVSVAAASILARHFFLIEIEKLSKKYLNDEILPLGAWNINIEKQMLNLIEKNGIKNQIEFYRFFCNLVKLHFKNSTKLIKMIEKKYN